MSEDKIMDVYLVSAGVFLFLWMVALIPLQIYLDMSTRKIIRRDYPDLWKEKISNHRPILEQIKFLRFIENINSYDSVNKKLRSRANLLRLVNWAYLILFSGMFISLLVSFLIF